MSRFSISLAAARPPGCLALAGAGTMMLVIAYGMVYGDVTVEGSTLLRMPWGVVTLVDVYIGLVLFSGWVLRREHNGVAAAGWIAAFLAAGNLATCVYVLKAAAESRNDPRSFWMGRDHEW